MIAMNQPWAAPVVCLLLVLIGAGSKLLDAQEEPTQRVSVARLTPEVRTAITRGLEYLAKPGIQNDDGSISWYGHMKNGSIICNRYA